MTLIQDITLAVALAIVAAVVVERLRSKKAGRNNPGQGENGTNTGGCKGFKFTVKFDKN